MITGAFAPITSGSPIGLAAVANLAATAAAQNLTLPGRTATYQVRIENHATDWAYFNFGLATVVAATVATGLGVAPGAVEVLTLDPSFTTASVILGSGTGTVRIGVGEGL